MSHWCSHYNVEIWTYCLMPNHVHLIAVPQDKQGLNLAIAEAHKRYSRQVNFREGWRGHLWQGRFASFIMDESYLLACAKYILLNPVRAKLVKAPEDWPWSSIKFHLDGKDDILVKTDAVSRIFGGSFRKILTLDIDECEMETFRKHERTGRPLGDVNFIEKMEILLDRKLKPQQPGPKKKIK
ncbi:MAG: transposase [Candidatus Magnetoglobus multicellularis str. Araruama]|uniref:Transposase n=1 Tax=Candidatus Magnetoglobus multicellularis str. Araruama TaxID=890399 RepID=A0A1V1NSK7_9BACT|nr:MAG: transposase [Candidatus Magnetoglobus multicellularis str. Araruama]